MIVASRTHRKQAVRTVFGEENRHATEPSRVMTLSSLCYPLGPQPSFPIIYGSIRPPRDDDEIIAGVFSVLT